MAAAIGRHEQEAKTMSSRAYETVKELLDTVEVFEIILRSVADRDLEKDAEEAALAMWKLNMLTSPLARDITSEFQRRPCKVLPFVRVS
jgi:hypothetical protein